MGLWTRPLRGQLRYYSHYLGHWFFNNSSASSPKPKIASRFSQYPSSQEIRDTSGAMLSWAGLGVKRRVWRDCFCFFAALCRSKSERSAPFPSGCTTSKFNGVAGGTDSTKSRASFGLRAIEGCRMPALALQSRMSSKRSVRITRARRSSHLSAFRRRSLCVPKRGENLKASRQTGCKNSDYAPQAGG